MIDKALRSNWTNATCKLIQGRDMNVFRLSMRTVDRRETLLHLAMSSSQGIMRDIRCFVACSRVLSCRNMTVPYVRYIARPSLLGSGCGS